MRIYAFTRKNSKKKAVIFQWNHGFSFGQSPRENGYYDHMLDLIRVMLGRALKTSPYVAGAVLMGCLRISKESVFTGMKIGRASCRERV